MNINKINNTTSPQQRHNKNRFVVQNINRLKVCCVIVVFVTFYFTVN
jgi:hypothetical protein